MVDRCPRCHHRFEREEGFFLGAYVVNLVVAQGLVILFAVVPCIVLLARNPDTGIVPFLVFYPFSKTVWTAFDLMLRPAEAREPGDLR